MERSWQPYEKVSIRQSVKEITEQDENYVSVMNIIFCRCLGMLNLTEIRRNFFDSNDARQIAVSYTLVKILSVTIIDTFICLAIYLFDYLFIYFWCSN